MNDQALLNKSMVTPNQFKRAIDLTKKERRKVASGIKSHKNYSPAKPDYSDDRNRYNEAVKMTNSAGLSRLRKPDLEGPDFVKLRRNVYTHADSGITNGSQLFGLQRMRRPTVITIGDLPKGAVAGAFPSGSKSAPRVISINRKQNEKIERFIPRRYVMAHESVHANTKRSAGRTFSLSRGRKKVSPTTRATQMEEARADDFAMRLTKVTPVGSYKTMSQVRPFKMKHYREHLAKLKKINENKIKKDDQASLNVSGKLHRIYREKNGDIVVNHAGTRKQNGSYDKINLSDVAGVKSVKGGVKATTNWHKKNPHTDVEKYATPAWTRSAGKNPKGGLNAKGRASAKAQGHNLKPPVKAGNNPRRASFLARMGNMPGPERKPNGEPTRLLLSLQAWGASSKADAKRKAASISRVEKATSLVFKGQMEIPGLGNVVRQTAKRKLPTQGRWRHLSGQTSQVRIVGPNSSSKDYFDVIDSKDIKRSLHRSRIIFTKDKPISKSIAYDSPMEQSRFGGASAVGKAYEDKPKPVWEQPNPNKDSDPLSAKRKASAKARAKAAGRPYPNLIDNMAVAKAKSKKRKKNGQPVRYNAQRPFEALANAEIAHERATAAGHTTVQTHAPVTPKTKPKTVSTARNSIRPSRPVPMPTTRRFLGPKPIAAGIGLAALGAYALHRRNKVSKANPMANRVLEGAARATGRARPVGSGSGGFAVDRKAMTNEASEAFRRANPVKSKELVLARKPGELVSTRPVVKPVASSTGKELERLPGVQPMPVPRGELVPSKKTLSDMKPKKSAVARSNASIKDKSYLAAGLAATGGGLFVGNEFSKAYDAQGNFIPDAPMRNSNNLGNTALAGAGVAGAAMGYKKLNTAAVLPQMAPNAASDAAAASAREQALKATRNSEKAMADAKVTAAQAGRKIPIVRNRRVKSAKKEAFKATKMATTQAQFADKATKEAARTATVARNVPKFQRATANRGLALIAGGSALAAAGMRNNRNS